MLRKLATWWQKTLLRHQRTGGSALSLIPCYALLASAVSRITAEHKNVVMNGVALAALEGCSA